MVVRRTSTVRVEARQRARQRTAERREERRKREQRVEELVEQHADALARVEEIRQRAEREVAEHLVRADHMVAELLTLGESVSAVADLLDLSPAEVRAARKRVRASGDGAVDAAVEDAAAPGGSDGSDTGDDAAGAAEGGPGEDGAARPLAGAAAAAG